MARTTESQKSRGGRRKALIIVAGIVVGAGLGYGAHVLFQAPDGDDTTKDIVDAPHPTPSPSTIGLLADLDWNRASSTIPEIDGWNPDADPGWMGVALDAGDLWALETVCGETSTVLYLVGPAGRRLELMSLPGCAQVVSWDHEAGLAYMGRGGGNDGPIVVDLATNQWAKIPHLSEWGDGVEYGISVYSMGTTSEGEAIWTVQGVVTWAGTWDPVDGWDMPALGISGWYLRPQGPSDWAGLFDWEADTVTLVNLVTHESVVLPGALETWGDTTYDFSLVWLDGDTIARPPMGDDGWMAYDAPAFATGRPIETEDFPLHMRETGAVVQFPGTPLVATVEARSEWDRTIGQLGVLTTEGYREIVDLTAPDAPNLSLYSFVEARPGVYLFSEYSRALLVVDVNTGEAYNYGITTDYPMDGTVYGLQVSRVVYVAPEGDAADTA